MTKRINLWSGPRNISTAMMYSFAQRADTKVEDEPFYGYYLKNSDAAPYHPGAEEIMNQMDTEAEVVLDRMNEDQSAEVFFYKNMTHHLLNFNNRFFDGFYQVILTRDPIDMLPSFDAVIENPNLDDVGYKRHMELVEKFEAENIPFVVIDAATFLANPENQLRQLCKFLDIPFDQKMLSWEAGARPEDGIWAEYWYSNVHKSTGFLPFRKKEQPFPEHLNELLEQCQPFYNSLKSMALSNE
ncbi:sulfotransferase-like domain-containing protein [Jiulongibacter sp. NS-SX5]|uniref:sulfotransferase-like domain-containing protein n=1 Tax=Jiulongibacter sp. NS-SX5 TaxID=3463854 RepID=UPI004058B968